MKKTFRYGLGDGEDVGCVETILRMGAAEGGRS